MSGELPITLKDNYLNELSNENQQETPYQTESINGELPIILKDNSLNELSNKIQDTQPTTLRINEWRTANKPTGLN